MTEPSDPWRTLGLLPGATADEVRRAYRRLAKANHPDAAGEGALPRFLAIQAAYEHLAGARVRRRPGARPGSRTARDPDGDQNGPQEPWRADPDRARASGRADRRRPGSRPTGRGSGPSTDGRPPPGSTGSEQRPPPGSGGPAAGRATDDPRRGPAGSSEQPRSRRPGGRRRAPNRATPYSTSYDPADEEPFEPGWSGATWYGASSGTYWTINPKEYADPRKHGEEYQRRARRSGGGWILDDAGAPDDGPPNDVDPTDARQSGDADQPGTASGGRPAAAADRATEAERDPRPRGSRRPSAAGRRQDTWTDARPAAPTGAAVAGGDRRRPPTEAAGPTDATASRRFTGPLLPAARTPLGRLLTAVLGWPPLGLGVAAAIGEETGCGRFAASCAELNAPGTWLVQAAIFVLLLAVPVVARWSAHGTVATLVVGVPTALVLSAGGGSRQPEASAATLAVLLLLAYVLGVAYALLLPLVQRRREPGIGR